MEANLGDRFVWWTGVVESRQDPKKVGRIRVRILGSHTDDKALVPTEDLPWAFVMVPLNDTSSLQVKEGDVVVGFYLDGQDQQTPIVMGILPGIPVELGPPSVGFNDPRTDGEVSSAPHRPDESASRYPSRLNEPTFSRLARNENISKTPIQTKKDEVVTGVVVAGLGGTPWDEPKTPYAATYPYNRVMETESGHILEFDDTPGAERIHIYHRSGTYVETHPDGTQVVHVAAEAFEVVLSDKKIYVKGELDITALTNVNIKAGLNVNIEAGGDIVLNATKSVITQAGVLQSHTSAGPMLLTGIPMELNGPPGEILPPPTPVT
jgi:hypothetical protein